MPQLLRLCHPRLKLVTEIWPKPGDWHTDAHRKLKETRKRQMIWVPICLGVFKVSVLGAAIFLSLKSHRDGEREQQKEREERPGEGTTGPEAVILPE